MITMKKKLFTLLMAIIAMASLHAQEGTIVYTDYGSDTVVGFNHHTITFDVDFDGEDDFYIQNYMGGPDDHLEYIRFCAINFDFTDLAYPVGQETGLGHDTIQTGDTLAQCNEWKHNFDFRWPCNICPEPYDSFWDGFSGYVGTRKKVEDSYYYGWIEFKSYWWFRYNGIWVPTVILYKTAFCTIPDYPLMAGQTSLDWGLDDTEATAFATIHPNPTTGLVTITGKALKQAEVLNTFGQCVTTTQGQGETLQIDIANLPVGIYFVRVTDKEGRKCVRKVVKE